MRLALAVALLLLPAAATAAVEVEMSARVRAAPDRVLETLADFESWDRTFTSVETLRAERLDARRARLRQRARMLGRTVTYTVAARVDAASRRVVLQLDPSEPSDLAMLHTTWRVRPAASGGSIVQLRVSTHSGIAVPAFVERRVVEETTRASLADVARVFHRSGEDI